MTKPLYILHLEDEPDDRELVQAALQRDVACEVESVSNRDQFEAALERGGFDLILSDFALPGFNGLAALEAARKKVPDVPFLLVSGTIGEEAAIASLRGGATDYVLKHRLSRLAPAVRRALSEAEERLKRKRAEDALHNEQQFLKALLENLDAGILACDADGKLTFVNRNTMEFSGLPENPLPSIQWESLYRLYRPDGKTSMSREETPLFRAFLGERVRNAEVVIVPTSGRARTMLVSGQPIIDAQDRKLGAVVAMHDITERKDLETQLRQAQKMEAVGRLAAGIAHDFNNLLSVILGYGEILQGGLEVGGRQRAAVDEVIRAGERAADLTRQLLAFSRKQILEPRILDLGSVVTGMDKMLRRLLGADVELRTRLAENPGKVRADPGQLEQVIMNLAVNARDAMPQGGELVIEVGIATPTECSPDPETRIEPGPYVMLAVSDTGCGMDEALRLRIFEPFFTTKEQGKGTGLGLSTVYGIVKQSGGQISVQSEPGKGTTFRVYLPEVGEVPTESRRESTKSVAKGTETVLIAEDDVPLRQLTRQHLESWGYNVLEAKGAPEALSIASGHEGPIHLLVSDVIMPVMNGRALAEQLSVLHPEMEVLYVSGYTDDVIAERGVLKEGTFFLSKPFTRDALVRKVRDVLDLRGRKRLQDLERTGTASGKR